MDQPFTLHSQRLTLRRLQPGDAEAILAYRSLPQVARYQSWEAYTLEEAEALIADQHRIVPNTPGTWLQLAFILRDTDQLIGTSGTLIGDCGIHFFEEDQAEIGFTLSPTFQGRGLATEAIGRVLDCLFCTLHKHRVIGMTDLRNEPAIKLFRRLGFREEGRLIEHAMYKGEWVSEYLFAMLGREWGRASQRTG
jgi:RimJ/RimL family protein N-acetyltransferase